MNRHEYLTALEKALKAKGVRDYNEIIEEYAEHYDLKSADGYTEAEITSRLAPPEEIAQQWSDISTKKESKIGQQIAAGIGFFFLDACLGIPIFISLYAWILSFAATTFAFALSGLVMALGIDRIYPLSEYVNVGFVMPYISSLFIGVALIALTVLVAIGTEYCRLYTNKLLAAYLRWHKTVLSGTTRNLPPKPIHPVIAPKKRRFMRNSILVSVLVFAISSMVAYASMVIASGSFEPWHIWAWFV